MVDGRILRLEDKQWRWLSFLCIITIAIYCVHGYIVWSLLLHIVTIFYFCFDHCSFDDYCDHFVCFSVQIYLVDACWSTGMLGLLGGTGIGQLEGVASLQDDSFLLQMSIMLSWVTLYFFLYEKDCDWKDLNPISTERIWDILLLVGVPRFPLASYCYIGISRDCFFLGGGPKKKRVCTPAW